MRLLIISDIHGRADSILHFTKIASEISPDQIIILGDVLYHGPRNDLPPNYEPKRVIEILSSLKDLIIAVKGNCEAEVDEMVLPFDISKSEKMIKDGERKILLTHGHHLENIKNDFDILMYGHTHVPLLERKDSKVILNPGSLSLPKNESVESYALYDGKKIEVRSLFNEELLMSLEL